MMPTSTPRVVKTKQPAKKQKEKCSFEGCNKVYSSLQACRLHWRKCHSSGRMLEDLNKKNHNINSNNNDVDNINPFLNSNSSDSEIDIDINNSNFKFDATSNINNEGLSNSADILYGSNVNNNNFEKITLRRRYSVDTPGYKTTNNHRIHNSAFFRKSLNNIHSINWDINLFENMLTDITPQDYNNIQNTIHGNNDDDNENSNNNNNINLSANVFHNGINNVNGSLPTSDLG
eukprot:Pgem_evm1s5871